MRSFAVSTFRPLAGCLAFLPALLLAIAAPMPVLHAEEGLLLLPKDIVLTGSKAVQRLIVQRTSGGEIGQEVRENLTFTSSDENIVRVVAGVLSPVRDGTATITATVGGKPQTSVEVRVVGSQEQEPWSFRNHVLPVMAKANCNAGACHGALAGKGGFKLSLRGYDPPTDFLTITRQARGRRIELADPGRSLILAKPTGVIPHKGGLRLEAGTLNYRVLAEWIAHGAPAPQEADARLERLEILPAMAVLKPGLKQQLLVQAFYSDGRVEDVTHWAKFTSTDDTVARVDENGFVEVVGNGEGAISAWFSSKVVIAKVTSPYDFDVPANVFADAPRRNFIDDLVLKQLQRLNLRPSPPAADAEFIRRVYLDTIGLLPTRFETVAFLQDKTPGKRDRLIEHLLEREEFADYWTYKWSDLLLINGTKLRPPAVKAYYQWIHKHVEANTPWNVFVREIVTATGGSLKNGATNFYALHQSPEDMTENVSQAFMGLSIGCAKCHNHPLEKWTNDQYYAMASLFARVRAKGWGGDGRSGDGRRTLFVSNKGELTQPRSGKPQQPAPLDGQPIPFDSQTDRRAYLADWLTSPENPYFARSISNRIWANYFGVGLIEAVDDMRVSNPASNEELLSAVAEYLVQNDFDLKSLMRVMLQSHAYQRSSEALPENKAESRFYSRYYPRRMMAEVLLDAVSQVSAAPTDFKEIVFPGADRKPTDFYPQGTRAIQLYDSAVDSYFLKTFGRNQRRITCECERSDDPSLVQVLHLSNGVTINKKLQAEGNRIEQWLAQGLNNKTIIEQAYLESLCRYPTDDEKKKLLEAIAAAPPEERRIALEDLLWAIFSSREFLFHH